MKNLILLSERRRVVSVPTVCALTRDPSAPRDDDDGTHVHLEGDILPSAFLLAPSGRLIAIGAQQRTDIEGRGPADDVCWVCDLNAIVPPSESGDYDSAPPTWLDVSYVDDLDALVCLSRGGAIVTVEKETGRAELVGEFDHGIEAGGWSPDREILALYTRTDADDGGEIPALMTMNAQFEVLAEVVPDGNNVPSPSGADGAAVSICWRPDGSALAVSSLDSSDDTRRIRTYRRDDLTLLSIGRSEDGSGKTVPNLLPESGIAWAGVGCSQLLAAVQRKGKRADTPRLVVFFEPNGLRHKEFKLRPDAGWEETIIGLCWNSESDVLAVTLRCAKQDKDGAAPEHRSKVQLWHRSNYHWYLKQEMRYDGANATTVQFDEESPYNLVVALQRISQSSNMARANFPLSELREYAFHWDASTVSKDGTAAAIDGSSLNFTPFHRAMVPPPMYLGTATLDAPVKGVSSVPSSVNGTSAVVWVSHLSDGSLVLLGDRSRLACDPSIEKRKTNGGFCETCVLANVSLSNSMTSEVREGLPVDMTTARQFLIINVKDQDTSIVVELLGVSCAEASSSNTASESLIEVQVSIDRTEKNDPKVLKVGRIPLEGRVLRAVNWSDSVSATSPPPLGALIELIDGTLLEYAPSQDGNSGNVRPSMAEAMLEPCPWIAALFSTDLTPGQQNDDHEHPSSKRVVVGMSRRLRLYFGERLLSDASSSFILSHPHKFLAYTTLGSRSQVRFIPLSALTEFDPLMGSEDNTGVLGEGYEPRSVERGSRLVTILPESPTVVLQMPRGNLEGIYPRALVLPFVMGLIDRGQYGLALDTMRRQKVDMNLIVDMDPFHFLEKGGVADFVAQVRDIPRLNVFISCLFDGNITEWKYIVPPWIRRSNGNALQEAKFDFSTKVNQVCAKIRDVMTQAENSGATRSGDAIAEGHFLLPILSTYAKESPPQLEEALKMIRNKALEKKVSHSKKSPLLSEKAQSSIQYLAFLADYKLLFDTALGMYDFELAKAVARNSQMDPKVYLPMLKRLKGLPECVARYEVDVRLERFESALVHLFRAGQETADTCDANSISDDHFAKCLSFIEEHKLHRLGVELFENHPGQKHKVMISLGERLLSEDNGDAAISIFLAADPPDANRAKRAARLCGDWRSYFACSEQWGDEIDHESRDSRRRKVAAEIAEKIADDKGGMNSKREGYASAARILLDYCHDVDGAVDMYVQAEMWSEGRRVARLNTREDLVRKCIDAAVSYGQACIDDFEVRATTFVETNERYMEVLRIRKEAVADGAVEGHADDDNRSLFSMASNASNTSLQSNVSGSSVGSITSVSSVISAGGKSTFSISSETDVNKHKSKFNKIGKTKKKKRKPSKRSTRKMIPGSEEELKTLVGLLKYSCAGDEYAEIIGETIQFLVQAGQLSLARALFEGYNDLVVKIRMSQQERKARMAQEKEEAEKHARREGQEYEDKKIWCEEDVDKLTCKELPGVIHHVFSFI